MSKKCNKIAKEFDVVVIGGGLAGMCAAIASARQGCKTALIQDRPVLGGNQSSEMQVGISGAVASGINYARNAREGGILEELWLENMYRNRVDYRRAFHMQDIIFWEKLTSEPNLELFLNTSATHPVQDETGRILAVEAVQPSTEKEFLFSGKIFIDASGDSRVAYEAGAEYRWGQEAKSEFHEGMAPEEAHDGVLCSSAVFCVKDMGAPVPFKAPACAYHFTDEDLLPYRPHYLDMYPAGNCLPREEAYDWWIEYGGIRDTVGDNEEIRDELYKIALGVWDHMKNGGDHGFDNYAISWITKLPAKRESRRLMGDYIVNENDVRGSTLFDDRVAYAGWPIDIHPPQGIFFKGPPCTQELLDDIWSIPFRSLYSKNIPNLMMAGRNISVSRIALGSARVMATCAIEGEAVGTAAGLCIAHNATPRELGQNHIRQLQQTLLKNGAYIKDMPNDDPLDLARTAKVSSSPDAAFALETSEDTYALETAAAQMVPITAARLDYVDLLLESSLAEGKELELRLAKASRINEFPKDNSVAAAKATVEPGCNWVRFHLNAATQKGMYWLILPAAEGISWHQQKRKLPAGARSASYRTSENRWAHKPGHCLVRLFPESKPYGCENIINGVTRPEKWTNLWVADGSDSQYLELEWEHTQEINTLHLSLDTDFELNIYGSPEWGMVTAPNCVKDYSISYWQDGQWVTLAQERENYQRRRVHTFPTISTTKIRLDFLASNSDVSAHVFEVRCYCE